MLYQEYSMRYPEISLFLWEGSTGSHIIETEVLVTWVILKLDGYPVGAGKKDRGSNKVVYICSVTF